MCRIVRTPRNVDEGSNKNFFFFISSVLFWPFDIFLCTDSYKREDPSSFFFFSRLHLYLFSWKPKSSNLQESFLYPSSSSSSLKRERKKKKRKEGYLFSTPCWPPSSYSPCFSLLFAAICWPVHPKTIHLEPGAHLFAGGWLHQRAVFSNFSFSFQINGKNTIL